VPAVIATGLENSACCHPDAVSLLKVTVASFVPDAVQRSPMWVPVFPAPL
jgi:hypothetical protein